MVEDCHGMENGHKLSAEFVLPNKLGMHARPAALFVRTANQFRAAITVAHGSLNGDGKSILGILMLAAGRGAALSITAEGDDAAEALEALGTLITTGFGED